jgi:Uma2 family endonuclease
MTVTTLMSADELLRLPDDGGRYELVRGELKKMSPAGAEHGFVAWNIVHSLGSYVKTQRLGRMYIAEAGFRIARNPDTVLAPDAAFVRADRVVPTDKYFEGAPDAAIEVVSPNDSYAEVQEKAAEWLRGGCRVVVVVDPKSRTVRVHRPGGSTDVTDTLAIEDVVPGWTIALRDIFE